MNILKYALEGNIEEFVITDLSFHVLAKAYMLSYRRSIKLKHDHISEEDLTIIQNHRKKALINITQPIDETLIDQGKKNKACAEYLYTQLQYKITEDDNANILAYFLCKVNDDSFYNHVLLYNVFINYNYEYKGKTMLHVATKYQHYHIVDYLLSQKLNHHYINTTPLHLAVKNHDMSLITKLSKVININALDVDGYAAIYYVAPGKKGNVQMFEWLLKHGADINIKYDDKTLLYYAVNENQYLAVSYLLTLGANPYTPCKMNISGHVYIERYELCIQLAIKKQYSSLNQQISNFRIIILLSKYEN